MYSREASKRLRQEFWIAFGKSYPRKWILYHTNIKGLAFKFHFDVKKAMVALDIDLEDLEQRIALWEKLLSLRSILLADFLKGVTFDDSFILENQKEICRIYIEKREVSIHDKNSWRETMIFFNEKMNAFEGFFEEYKDIIAIK